LRSVRDQHPIASHGSDVLRENSPSGPMGYTIFAGCDHGSDIWQTAVQLSALRDALEEKGDGAAVQTSVVCCSSVSAPAGSPLVKIVQTAADGSVGEVVAGGQADKFYSIREIEAQLSTAAVPSAPSRAAKAAPPPVLEAAAVGGTVLASGKDYVIVLSGKGNCDPWAAAVETAQLRIRIQEASGGCLPAVVHNAASPAAVTVMALPGDGSPGEGEVLCSGASFAEVQAGLCGGGAPAAAPCAEKASSDVGPPAAAPCTEKVSSDVGPPAAAPCTEKASSEKISRPAAPGPETPTRTVPVPPPNTPPAEKTPPSAPVSVPKEGISEEPLEPSAAALAQTPSSQEPAAAPPSSQEPVAAEGGQGPFQSIRSLLRKVWAAASVWGSAEASATVE